MSASAGKVMPRPMGDYNALTEYKILDIVTYNNRPYMAKQTTTGNLPTNTTYWMNLLNFPTEVDDAPTQNSQNLVYSGGVYSAEAGKMDIDGSNASIVDIGGSEVYSMTAATITKDAGDNETLTIHIVVPDNASTGKQTEVIATQLAANIGNTKCSYIDGGYVYIDITQVNYEIANPGDDDIYVKAKLVEDDPNAISLSNKTLYIAGQVSGSYSAALGNACAVKGSYSQAIGFHSAVNSNKGTAEGDECAVGLLGGHAEGCRTYATNGGHAEGKYTKATGTASHAEGVGTKAAYEGQSVVGKYNNNKSGTVFEVGNGSLAAPSNAFEVYSDGTISQNGTDKYKFAKSGGVDGFYDSSNNFHPFTGYREFVNNSVTLSTSADTVVTFTDASITADSTVEPFTSVYEIVPKDCVATAGQCVVTIPKQSTAQTIKVKIRVS